MKIVLNGKVLVRAIRRPKIGKVTMGWIYSSRNVFVGLSLAVLMVLYPTERVAMHSIVKAQNKRLETPSFA
jgi:hypothetical protein